MKTSFLPRSVSVANCLKLEVEVCFNWNVVAAQLSKSLPHHSHMYFLTFPFPLEYSLCVIVRVYVCVLVWRCASMCVCWWGGVLVCVCAGGEVC